MFGKFSKLNPHLHSVKMAVWEVRAFFPVRGSSFEDGKSLTNKLCEALSIQFIGRSPEVRTDLYLVGPNPEEGMKYRSGDETSGSLEKKQVVNRSGDGGECMIKTFSSRITDLDRERIEGYVRIPIKKHRWSSFHENEVTILDVISGVDLEYKMWITVCLEGMKEIEVPRAVNYLNVVLEDKVSTEDIQRCSYSRWLHRLIIKSVPKI
jgi:hypothetical protein